MKLQFNLKKKNAIAIDEKKKIIKKFFFSFNNSQYINEKKGYRWYFHQLREKKKISIGFNFLTIPFFEGNQVKFWGSIIHYKYEIKLVLAHYKTIWPKYSLEKKFPIHGDLTFSNIIFLSNNFDIRFIDWENFSEKANWGLDICYFLLSTVILPVLSRKQSNIFVNELLLFNKIWKSFFKSHEDLIYLKDPINFIKNSIYLPKDHFFNFVDKAMYKKVKQAIK